MNRIFTSRYIRNTLAAPMLTAATVFGIAATSSRAVAHDVAPIAVSDLTLDVDPGRPGRLLLTLHPSALGVKSEGEMILTPVLTSADSTQNRHLPAMVVAGRNHLLRYQRGQRNLPEGAEAISAKDGNPVSYNCEFPYQEWMAHSSLAVDVETQGCCGKPVKRYSVPVAVVDLTEPTLRIPETFELKAVANADPKIIDLKGQAYIDFRVNRTEIDPSYRRNVPELRKIMNTIDVARDNPDATITGLSIKGYASPEGSYTNNIRLAKGRTASLKDYIRSTYGFEESLFHTDFEPEDWQGLRDSVMTIPLPNSKGLLAIIDSDLQPDPKDAALKREYPTDYAYLLEHVYPALRHSDYVVTYQIRQYTTPDDVRRALCERPDNVNERELLMLLGACEPGGEEFNSVVEQGVKMFPANNDLQYLYGVLLAQRGDHEAALEHLRLGADGGIPEATQALESLHSVMNPRPVVEYVDL